MRGPQVRFCERRGGATCRAYSTRSAAAGKTVAPEPPAPPRLDPEVVATAKRRTFTAKYKLRILAEADAAAAQPGAIGALSGAGDWKGSAGGGIGLSQNPQF